MAAAVAFFLRCCGRVLQGDEELLEQLRGHGFACGAGCWRFSLPALHAFLAERIGDDCPDYPRFRRQLFASDCNARLRSLGAEIAIADNHGKVDESLYVLQRISL